MFIVNVINLFEIHRYNSEDYLEEIMGSDDSIVVENGLSKALYPCQKPS